jgi:peroxiredoxin
MLQTDTTVPEQMEAIQPLLIGATIPTLKLRKSTGEAFDVNAALREQPGVLLFYRGGWCGFCQKQLVELRQHYDAVQALGFQVLAISPDTPDNATETAEKYRLPFPVLSDTSMQSAIDFGIAWRVSDRDDEYYAKLQRASGETHRILPVPAYFIVDATQRILFAYVNPNYRVRPPFSLMQAGIEAARQQLEAESA